MTRTRIAGEPTDLDVVIVGAGFSGLYAVYKLRGEGHRVRAYEAGSDVGGTWYWNRYPGARVDVESREYSFGFSEELENEWRWSEEYSAQPELLDYARHIADRFDLRRDIQLETKVTSAIYDEDRNLWTVTTDRGDRVTTRFFVTALGILSVPKDIDIPGAGNFKGELYRTSLWPKHDVSFAGKRVAVVGTGSSGVQIIPIIAEQAEHLTVFQRSAVYSLPSRNGPMPDETVADWLANREEYRHRQRQSFFGLIATDVSPEKVADVSEEERRRIFEERWNKGGFSLIGSFSDILTDEDANEVAAEFVREKIREIVKDPDVAARLMPTNHPVFTKRPSVDTGYYETYNRDNVSLVDVGAEPIDEITETGIRVGGKDHEFDMIVLAIGFDAMTGAFNRIDIRGLDGLRLRDEWADGPRSYLGLGMAGFPNMFVIIGPGSPSILGNQMASMEHNVGWIADCIRYMEEHEIAGLHPTVEAQDDWMEKVRESADRTLYPRAKSWYMGDNVAGKPRMFLAFIGGWKIYLDRCDEVAELGYEGFSLIPAREVASGETADRREAG